MKSKQRYMPFLALGATAAFGIAAVLAFTSLARAQYTPSANMPSSTSSPQTVAPPSTFSQNVPAAPPVLPAAYPPMIVSIDRTGGVLLRGIAMPSATSSIATTTPGAAAFAVNSWGGTWTVRLWQRTQMFPAGLPNSANPGALPAGISTGDFIGLIGTVAGDEPLTIDATLVRDWTLTLGAR